MRTAFFCVLLLAVPALLAQSPVPLTMSPGAPLPSHPGKLIVVAPQAQDWWAQQPDGSVRVPLLPQNRPFAFAMPTPPAPIGRMEPIPTQWPSAKMEAIPTRWPQLKAVPIGGAGAASGPAPAAAALFLQPARK
jgi:hypothetical protein